MGAVSTAFQGICLKMNQKSLKYMSLMSKSVTSLAMALLIDNLCHSA
jgi:hypothetical protein